MTDPTFIGASQTLRRPSLLRRHPLLPSVAIGVVAGLLVTSIVQGTGLGDGVASVLQQFTRFRISNATGDGVAGTIGLLGMWWTARIAFVNLRQPDLTPKRFWRHPGYVLTHEDSTDSHIKATLAEITGKPEERTRAAAWLSDNQRRLEAWARSEAELTEQGAAISSEEEFRLWRAAYDGQEKFRR